MGLIVSGFECEWVWVCVGLNVSGFECDWI